MYVGSDETPKYQQGKKRKKKENHTGFVGIRGTFITEVKYVSSRTRLGREKGKERGL